MTERAKSILRIAPGLLPVSLLVVTGLAGIDFGMHWDELPFQLAPARTMIASGTLLPGVYWYPGVARWLWVLPAIPDGLIAAASAGLKQGILSVMDRPDYLFRARAEFIVVSALCPLWLYLAVLAWRKSVVEAFLAASFQALSWEFAYHSRWAVTDCVMASFAALTLFLSVRHRATPDQRRWLWLAAGAAGVTFGTKYPGGLILLPVLVAAWQGLGAARTFRRVATTFAGAGGIFIAVYLLTTPGTIFDFAKLETDVAWVMNAYKTGWGAYTVEPGLIHLGRILKYFSMAYFSHALPVAVALFVAMLAGLVALLRRSAWADAALLLPVPMLYVIYFGTQMVMMVRNLQIVGIFAAVLAARGVVGLVTWTREKLAQRSAKAASSYFVAASIAVGVMLVVNAWWLITAAASIRTRTTTPYGPPALAWINAHPDYRVALTNNMRSAFDQAKLVLPKNVVSDRGAATHLVQFARLDHPGSGAGWVANDPQLTAGVFGPFEVNINYYPTWFGDERIVVVPMEKAKELNVWTLE